MNAPIGTRCALAAAVLISAAAASAAQTQDAAAVAGQTDAAESSQNQVPELRAGPSLEKAFEDMYRLKFEDARATIGAYDRVHPNDPLGASAQAASYLFEEFQRKGVFSSAFFLDDKKLLVGVDGSVEENRNPKFLEADGRARKLARDRLGADSRDAEALLALTLADGMESDYDALIEKKQIASLELMRQADGEASRVLALDPNLQDAYVSLGVAGYIIGCLPSYKRAILWFGGIHGDRMRGITLMQNAVDHGHYLQPFAKIMLALADEREHHFDLAQQLLAQLAQQFPENPYFEQELVIAQRAAHKQ
ncbi:MAG TPA: hypothetical protein VEJ39_07875 [Candidatus Acidoferrales bacterium]|nr:hypothetical protein [Candidatus Acidoferrales bacterium]